MAKYSNVVEYNIVTDVDTSGIIKLQNELIKLKRSLKFDKSSFSQFGFDDAKIEKSIRKVNQLQSALTAAFNPKIGTIDLSKLNTSLQKEHTSLQMIVKDWEQMGTRGTMAISNLSNALLSMNKSTMNVNTTLSKIANTFSNTVRWGITASIFQEMMSSVQGAVSYMKDLDESLTQIQMVTNSSKEDMRELALYANNAAQALGSTTTDYTNAVKVFVQEGFSESESKQYANLSTKLANVSEQNTATTSDQITAFRNAFQLDYEQTVAAMDKVANVANNTASNVNELMTASQRAASVAQAVGTSQDSFLAAIATIESVTRQSAEEIGNGLKTIYQRFADIKVSGSTEDGVDYGQYASALKSIGVDVLDAAGEFKGMDQILKETQEVWSGLSETMKVAVGEKVAGKFQYNRFAALMNNPEYYQKALGATQDAEGMMDQMNEHYMNSIEGRLNTLQAAGEQVMSTLFDQDSIEPIIGQVTELVNGLNNIVTAVGGLNGLLPALSAIMLRTFSTQIAGTAANIASSIGNIVSNTINSNNLNASVELLGLKNYSQSNGSSVAGKLVSGVADNYDQLSIGTQEKIRDLSQQIVELEEQKNNVLKEQEKYFKNINANAIEEKNLLSQQRQEYVEQLDLLKKKQQAGNASTEEIEKATILENETIPTLRKKIEAYKNISKEVNGYVAKLVNGEKLDSNVVNHLLKMKKEADRLGISISNLEELMERLDTASNNLRIGDKMVDAAIKSAALESNINNMIKGLSGITSISFGISMISETFRVLGDETSSLKEKLDAVAMNGLMGITMLVPGIMQSVSAVRELGKAWEAWRIQQAAALAIEELFADKQALNIALRGNNIKTIALESLEQGKLNKEKMVAKLVETGYTESVAKQIATKTANLAIDEASEKVTTRQIIGTGLRTTATNVLTAALIKLGFAEEFANAAAGPLGIALIAVAAIATAVFAAVNQVAEAEEKRKQQLEEQVNASNEIIQKLNETKTAYDEAYNSYKQTGKASEDLKNKSIELAEALKIEGAQALANAGMYDELNGKIQQAAINQREYNNALLEQQAEDLNKQNSTYNYDWQNMAYGADGSLVGTGPIPASITSGEERIKTKKSAIETAEKEITTAREQLALLDNTKDGYIEEKAALEELIKTKQTYITQNALTENEEKQVEVYKGAAENTANIFKDSGLFDNITDYQEVIDELQSNEDIKKYLSFLGEEEARAWIQAYTQEILASKTSILEAYQEAIANENAAFDAYNTGRVYGDNNVLLQEQLKSSGINSVEDFSKAIEDGTVNIEGFAESVESLKSATEDLTKNINDNDFTNRLDFGLDPDDNDKEYKKFLKDQDITESALSRMSRDTYEDGAYYQQQKENLENLIEAKQKNTYVSDEEAKEIEKLKSKLDGLESSAKDTTIMILRMSNGVVSLRNKISDISEILSNDALKGTVEWYEALDDLDSGLSEVLNIDAGTLSDTFLESGDALAYARRMAEGDMSAIDDLRKAASQDIIQNLSIQLKEGEDIDTVRSDLLSGLNQLQAEIDAGTITITTDLDDNLFIQKLNKMLADSQISAEQASNILSSIGMEANIKYAEGKGTVDAVEYEVSIDHPVGPMPDGTQMPPRIRMIPHMVPVPTTTKIPYLEGAHYTGSGVQTASAAARNPSYTGGYSNNPKPKSSSSSPKKSSSPKQSKNNEKKKKQKSEWDYLTNITNDLERQASIIEKLSKLENKLYGANRVKQLKTLQAEHKKNIKLLEREEEIAKKHAERLRTRAKDENGNLTINGYAYRAGISQLKFDGQGNLDNGRQIEQALLAKVNQATKDYNKHRNDDNASYYNQKLDIAKNDYDGFLKAMSDYQATLGKIEDIQSEKQEEKEQLQDMTDAIVDSIQEGIEDILKAMNNQREFDRLSRNWKEGGNSYSHFASDRMYYSEGLSSLLSPVAGGKSTFNTQLESLQNRIADAEDVFDGDSSDADDEKLSEQDAFENLQEATEHVMDSLNKMVDYYDSLIETIQEASDKMDELIDNRLEQYDRLEDYLDTRLDQLTLLFGDKSYGEQAEFYSEKIDVNMQKMVDISTAIKEKQATVDTLKELEEKGRQLSSEEREELKDAKNKVNELQKEQLSTETKLLQDISNKLKAQTSAEMDKLVKNLFNGADVEWLSEQWEIATRNSEKYLDDYNRAFELEKLQLKFQEALNDSQNTSLKTQQRIADLGDEYLTYLREKNKLSEYDVKQAEAQLNILQKQIALEEARDNKSQMRLQRNAAGNYDFVYAADQNAMNQAAEALLAAQQESYNLSKQKYLETYNSAYEAALKTKDMVVSIATDASISVEERTERIKFVLDSLNEYLQGSRVELNEISINLYNDFVEAENLIAEENQGKLDEIFEEMRINTAALIAEINAGINSVKETGTTGLEDFQDALSTTLPGFEGSISNSLNNIKGNVSDSIKSIEESLTGSGGFQGTVISIFDKIGEEGSNSFDKMAENITKESDDGHLKRIRVGTINTANEISEYITNTTLPTINSQFALSGQAVLTTVENIHGEIEKAFNAITGAGETSDAVTGEGEKVEGYLEQFQKANKQALEVAGQDYNNFKTDSIDVVDDALNDLRDTTQDWQNDLVNLNVEISNCKNEIKFWKEQIDNAIESTKKDIKQSNDLQIKLSSLASQAATTSGNVEGLGWAADWATEAQYNAAEAASDLTGQAYDAAEAASQAADAYRDMAAAAQEAANAGASSSGGERWAVSDGNGVVAGKKGFSSYDAALKWARKSAMDNPYIYQYDTGGYTGTWSLNEGIDEKNGKLAVLHQKELVLNATDTENILSAVELVRDIMSGINSIPSLGKLSNQNNFNDTIEQRVEINATFPGVTTVLDIEQALLGLADSAYQYANKYQY